MHNTNPVSDVLKAKVIGLHQSGHSSYQIYKQLKANISMASVYRIVKNSKNIIKTKTNNNIFMQQVAKTKKDDLSQLQDKIQFAFKALTEEKFDQGKVRDIVISLATLIDKRELLSGNATDRIDVQGMTHIERIQFIRTGKMPDRMNGRLKEIEGATSQ